MDLSSKELKTVGFSKLNERSTSDSCSKSLEGLLRGSWAQKVQLGPGDSVFLIISCVLYMCIIWYNMCVSLMCLIDVSWFVYSLHICSYLSFDSFHFFPENVSSKIPHVPGVNASRTDEANRWTCSVGRRKMNDSRSAAKVPRPEQVAY